MLKQEITTTAALLVVLVSFATAQRVVPGVNPQHYQAPVQQQQHPPPPQYQQQVHVAPGVPQQQYQQQQYQQVPVQQQQYQQVPVQQQQQQQQQYQQVPVLQQQQQQPLPQQQQQPQVVQQQHGGHAHPQQQVPHQAHHGHHNGQQVLNTGNIQHERAHIQEHMQVPIDTSKMSEAELQFHYFKMHDSDNNNKLDGCELIKSLIHWHVADDKKHAAGENHHDDHDKKPDGDKKADDDADGTGHREGTIYTDQGLSDVIDYVLKTMDLNNDGYVDYTEYRKSEGNVGKEEEEH